MKKLLLTSIFQIVSEELTKILPAPASSLTVGFIPTAADVYEDKSFVEDDRKRLVEMGFRIIDVPLKDHNPKTLKEVLDTVDIIFVGGGNTFYLLQEARRSGFDTLAPTLVKEGAIYVGSSAGSYLACPTIEAAGWKRQDRNIVNLTDLTAMALVPFIMSVHYRGEFASVLKEGAAKSKYPLKVITDEQALLVVDGVVTLVGRGEEVTL